jgi:hypothetical protein
LEPERVNFGVGVGIPRRVESAIGIEPREPTAGRGRGAAARDDRVERAAEDDLAIGLHGDGGDSVVGLHIELGIRGAVRIQPGETCAGGGDAVFWAERGEGTADEDLVAVTKKRQTEDRSVGIWVKRSVDGAVGVEPGQVVARRRADRAEGAADDNSAVGLDGDRHHLGHTGTADIGVERKVYSTIRENPREAITRGQGRRVRVVRLQLGEKTADDDAAVRLEREGGDVTVRTGVELEIEGAVRVKAGEIDAVDPVGGAIRQNGVKRTAHNHFAISLSDGGEDGAIEVRVKTVVGGGRLAEQSSGGGDQEGTRANERADAGAEGQ